MVSGYQRSTVVSLKSHPLYNERWLQDRIVEDPTILGLGDLEIRDQERQQPRGGRLDMLFSDPETKTRYEVELQLGATDESHIIRTIEYWDLERTRYPQYDHVAVIVAEDITSRFLNVINLFNKAIPIIAIQVQALQVGDVLTLNAMTVLDLTSLGTDDEDEPGQATDRAYWVQRGTRKTVAVADELVALVNEVVPDTEPKYNKFYIGLLRQGVVRNFALFRPKKEFCLAEFKIERSEELTARIDDSGLDRMGYDQRYGNYRLRLTKADVTKHRDLLLDLISRASGEPRPDAPEEPAVF